jgi:hypothetical protein
MTPRVILGSLGSSGLPMDILSASPRNQPTFDSTGTIVQARLARKRAWSFPFTTKVNQVVYLATNMSSGLVHNCSSPPSSLYKLPFLLNFAPQNCRVTVR